MNINVKVSSKYKNLQAFCLLVLACTLAPFSNVEFYNLVIFYAGAMPITFSWVYLVSNTTKHFIKGIMCFFMILLAMFIFDSGNTIVIAFITTLVYASVLVFYKGRK